MSRHFRVSSSNRINAPVLASVRAKHTLPELGYDYSALEPTICREIMELHHSKHHQTYVTNFNAAEAQLEEALSKNDTSKVIALQNALRFNGGGHLNHAIFWKNLTPAKTEPSKELNDALTATFGSIQNFKKELTTQTVAVQGSGWGWLGYNRKNGQVQIATCANQDPLEATTGMSRYLDGNYRGSHLLLIIRHHLQAWYRCLASTYGNMHTTFNTKMFGQIMWKLFSISSIGKMFRLVWLPPRPNKSSDLLVADFPV